MSEFTGQQSYNMLLIRLEIERKCQIPLSGNTNEHHPVSRQKCPELYIRSNITSRIKWKSEQIHI